MNSLQKRLLVLLKEIDSICKKHNITYYIDGGSAIGAIRHHGFIPWDDDIDIAMTRKNFEKFESVIDSEISENRKYESFKRNNKYSMLYSRYCDKTSTSILRTSMLDVFESGAFIDIFVLDPIPNGEKKQKHFLKSFTAYAEYINPYYYDQVVNGNYFLYLKYKFLDFILGRKKLHKYMEKKLFSYKEEECDNYCLRFDLIQYIYPKDCFKEPRYMLFEDFMAPVPTKIEEYLKIHYGNTWMLIPEPDNQDIHNVVTNLNIDYQTFKNDYMPFIKTNSIDVYNKFHKKRIKNYNYSLKIDKQTAKINAIKHCLHLKNAYNREEIDKLFKNKKYKELLNIFDYYYQAQLEKTIIKNNIIINIDNYDYDAIKVLLLNGMYYKAKKILNLIKGKYPDLEKVASYIEEINDNYYSDNLNSYYALINDFEAKEEFFDTVDIVNGKIKQFINKKEYAKANELVNKYLEIYSDNYLLKYKADLLFMKNKNDAIKIYEEIMQNTNNGILKIEIDKILKGVK